MTEIGQLLADYVKNGSDEAFRELVRRYINFVHTTALRLVGGDSQLAEDVTQTVFIGLAQKAQSLSGEVMLGGWLHQRTFHVATRLVRGERRRQSRESEAAQMNAQADNSEARLRQLAPLLDEAITQLGSDDRTAILLRFFEQRDFHSVGSAIGASEDAARMRVGRALEKLHAILKRQGVTLSIAALATALTIEAAKAAPATLAAKVAGVALAATAGGGGTAATILKLMTMTKLQTGIVGVIALAAVVAPLAIYQQSQARLRAKDAVLQEQNARMDALINENTRLSQSAARGTNTLSQDQLNDLMRLRGEVGSLKKQLAAATKPPASPPKNPASPPVDLQQQQRDEALQRQQAMVKLGYARNWILAQILYSQANGGNFPSNLSQAAALLPDERKDETLLATNQFEIVYQGLGQAIANPSSTIILREIPVPGATLRTYGFADGHSEIHRAEDGDFQAYESQHMIPQPTQP